MTIVTATGGCGTNPCSVVGVPRLPANGWVVPANAQCRRLPILNRSPLSGSMEGKTIQRFVFNS